VAAQPVKTRAAPRRKVLRIMVLSLFDVDVTSILP
jgi:hypothetical protein